MEIIDTIFEKCSDCGLEYKIEEGLEGIIIPKITNDRPGTSSDQRYSLLDYKSQYFHKKSYSGGYI